MSSQWILDHYSLLIEKPRLIHASDAQNLADELRGTGFTVAVVDGVGVRDETELLVRIGAALAFPKYFGGNWNAFVDCAGDLPERFAPIALIWLDADELLASSLHQFVNAVYVLNRTADDLAISDARFQLEVFVSGRTDAFRRNRSPRRS